MPRRARRHGADRSSTSTSRSPSSARWYATLAPTMPAPTTTVRARAGRSPPRAAGSNEVAVRSRSSSRSTLGSVAEVADPPAGRRRSRLQIGGAPVVSAHQRQRRSASSSSSGRRVHGTLCVARGRRSSRNRPRSAAASGAAAEPDAGVDALRRRAQQRSEHTAEAGQRVADPGRVGTSRGASRSPPPAGRAGGAPTPAPASPARASPARTPSRRRSPRASRARRRRGARCTCRPRRPGSRDPSIAPPPAAAAAATVIRNGDSTCVAIVVSLPSSVNVLAAE